MAGPHACDWAGAGYTTPGPEAHPSHWAGCTLGKTGAFAGMTTNSSGAATSFTGGYFARRQAPHHLALARAGIRHPPRARTGTSKHQPASAHQAGAERRNSDWQHW